MIYVITAFVGFVLALAGLWGHRQMNQTQRAANRLRLSLENERERLHKEAIDYETEAEQMAADRFKQAAKHRDLVGTVERWNSASERIGRRSKTDGTTIE